MSKLPISPLNLEVRVNSTTTLESRRSGLTRPSFCTTGASRYSARKAPLNDSMNALSVGLSGRENEGTGLYFYRARYHDPTLARFISEDPIGFAGGINLYGYLANDPLRYTDPFGMDKKAQPAADQPQAQAPPWYKNSCVTGALGKGGLSVGIDSIGLIPEAGGIARVIGHQAGYVGVVADQAGSRLIGAVDATANTGRGLAGLTDTSPTGLASTGLTMAGFIPGLNDAAAVGSIGLDLFRTAKAIGACY
jgi:RHS repeat-associated protein